MAQVNTTWQNRSVTQVVPSPCLIRKDLAELASLPSHLPRRRSSWVGCISDRQLVSSLQHAVGDPSSKTKKTVPACKHNDLLREKLATYLAETAQQEDDDFCLPLLGPEVDSNGSNQHDGGRRACEVATSGPRRSPPVSLTWRHQMSGADRHFFLVRPHWRFAHPQDGNQGEDDGFAAKQGEHPRGFDI